MIFERSERSERGERGERGERENQPERGERGGRRRHCRFCTDPELKVDYKDVKTLKPFLTEREKIAPPRITGLCTFHQRQVARAVKQGRILGIIPFASAQRSL